MCNYFSCIVTRDLKVLWLEEHPDEHEPILKKYKIEDSKLENRDFVRIEIVPKDEENVTRNREDWILKVDEEKTLPKWFIENEEKAKEKCWEAWEQSIQVNLAVQLERKEVRGSVMLYAYGRSHVKAYDSAVIKAFNHSMVEANNNSMIIAFDNSEVEAYNNSIVEAGNNSVVEAHDYAKVRAYHDSTVETNRCNIVQAYDRSIVKASGSTIVEANNKSTIEVDGGSVVRVYGRCKVKALGNSVVHLYEGEAEAYGNSVIRVYDENSVVRVMSEKAIVLKWGKIVVHPKSEIEIIKTDMV